MSDTFLNFTFMYPNGVTAFWNVTEDSTNEYSSRLGLTSRETAAKSALDYVEITLLMLFSTFGIFGNSSMLVIIWKLKKLHFGTAVMMTSQSLSDLLMCGIIVTFYAYGKWERSWILGDTLCGVLAMSDVVLAFITLYTFMTMAIVRLIAVITPVHSYRNIVNPTCSVVTVLLTWAFPVVMCVIFKFAGLFDTGFADIFHVCGLVVSFDNMDDKKIALLSLVVGMSALPFSIMCYCYMQIYITLCQKIGPLNSLASHLSYRQMTKSVLLQTLVFTVSFLPFWLVMSLYIARYPVSSALSFLAVSIHVYIYGRRLLKSVPCIMYFYYYYCIIDKLNILFNTRQLSPCNSKIASPYTLCKELCKAAQ